MTGTLNSTVPLPVASISATVTNPVTGTLGPTVPLPVASLVATVIDPPEILAAFGLILDSTATVDVGTVLAAAAATVPLHVAVPTVPVPVLVGGRPS